MEHMLCQQLLLLSALDFFPFMLLILHLENKWKNLWHTVRKALLLHSIIIDEMFEVSQKGVLG
jgi:hypothetical protein